MNPSWSNRLQPQQTGWQQPQQAPYGLAPQMTGYPGQQQQQQQVGMQHSGMAGMGVGMGMGVPQMQLPMQTGMYQQPQQPQPMLGSFSAVPTSFLSTFMPSNPNAGWAGQQQQYQQPQHPQQQQQAPPPSLPEYFASHNQQTMGQTQVQVQWALTADERRNYDKIFRAWDAGTGYITGQRATEVFQESGLEREDLMKVWALSDRENRGKLNLAEFHVAMGLIYRKLSGNPIPDVLPAEMVPPSSRDLDSSVDFLKDLLRSDTNQRSTNVDPGQTTSKYAKVRSFNHGATPEPPSASGKDATVYKHDDTKVKTYKSSSRHLDRRNVRFQGEESSGSNELDDLKKQLQSSHDALEKSFKDEDEDEDLKVEIEDLKYRIRRVQEDIEFNKSGKRNERKDNERRRLERELLFLMHEKLPELEDKMRERDRKKRSDDRAAAYKRDARNNKGRFDREPAGSSSSSKQRRRDDESSDDDEEDQQEEEEERGYLRGSYSGRSAERRSESPKRTSSGSNGKHSIHDAAPSPPPASRAAEPSAVKSPPPPPAPPAATTAARSATSSPAPPAAKMPQNKEERQAYIRAEAQRRVQERMRMLTGQSPSSSPAPEEPLPSSYESSLAARMEQDKLDAARRAETEDKALEERERQRQLKLEEERAARLRTEQSSLADRQQALSKVSDEVTASEVRSAGAQNGAASAVAASAARDELNAEEGAVREKEQQLEREKSENEARLKQLSLNGSLGKKAAPPAPPSRGTGGKAAPPKPPPSRKQPAAAPASPAQVSASKPVSPPPAPTPPVAVASPAAASKSASTNPFHRLGAAAGASPAAQAAAGSSPSPGPAKGANNPFFRPPTGASTVAAAQTSTPIAQPTAIKPQRAAASHEDDWGDAGHKKDDSDEDSDDDEFGSGVKQKRAGLAGLLFGGTSGSAPTSRPGSAAPGSPAVGAPAPPRAPAAPLPPLGAAAGAPPPRSALLGAIQGGAKLRKAVTNDRSLAAGAGSVIGDASAPVQTYVPPPSPPSGPSTLAVQDNDDRALNASPAAMDDQPAVTKETEASNKRQSVDWYGSLASDAYLDGTAPSQGANRMPEVSEEAEEDDVEPASVAPDNEPIASSAAVDDPESDFDFEKSLQVRSLYAYDGQRDQDASFAANLLILAHPPKDASSDWMYGMVSATGRKGWLPKTYVEELAFNTPAKILYNFAGEGEDELKVQAGDNVVICEKLDGDWARAVLNGHIGLVPLTYLEENQTRHASADVVDNALHPSAQLTAGQQRAEGSQRGEYQSSTRPAQVNNAHSGSGDESESEESDYEDVPTHATSEEERLRVLEAAGLVVQQASGSSASKRRPPPPRPRPRLGDEAGSSTSTRASYHADDERSGLSHDANDLGPEEYPIDTDDAYAKWQALQCEGTPATESISRTNNGLDSIPARTPGTPAVEAVSATIASTSPGTPGAGNTWSSLIAPDALLDLPDKARKRQEAIFELIKSEATFLTSMQLIIKEWFTKLQPLLDEKASTVIFANIEDIMIWSTTFLSDLEARQRDCRLFVDRIGDVARTHAGGIDVYRPYCINQTNAANVLASLRSENAEVAAVAALRVNGLSLDHFLLEPMQRLARYPLLLGQILQYTEADESDRGDVAAALETAQKVLNRTNEQIRQQEIQEKLAYLSDNLVFVDDPDIRLDLTAKTRFMGPRTLLKEGRLVKGFNHTRQSKRKELDAYLFNDLLLLTTTSKGFGLRERLSTMNAGHVTESSIVVYRAPIPLDEMSVRAGKGEQVLVVSHRGEETKLEASSARQRQEWLGKLNAARESVLSARQKQAGRG